MITTKLDARFYTASLACAPCAATSVTFARSQG